MSADNKLSIRLPNDLKAEVARVAQETDRSMSNAALWLLRRGIKAYKADGLLVESLRVSVHEADDEKVPKRKRA